MPTSTLSKQEVNKQEASSLEHVVYLALQRLAVRLRDEAEALLKQEGLSITQFNVLRVLRGAGDDGLTCGDIGERLINKDPDVTRLLDRMEREGLVERARSTRDRRVVLTRISAKGLALVSQFDLPLADLHQRQLGQLGPERLNQLLRLLEKAALPAEEAA